MKPKASFWQRIGLHDFFLKKETVDDDKAQPGLTPNDVFKYILEKFNESIEQLSFANRIVFYHEYIIAFNPDDFQEFMDNKKGIFGLIVQESVRSFYEALNNHRASGKTVEPSSSKWVFRFVSNASYARGDKSFIGKLLPGSQQKEENLRVTFIPRQTGIAQTFDINPEILKGFTFYSEGYYEVPYQDDLVYDERKQSGPSQSIAYARLETILPDKAFAGRKLEFLMRYEEIMVSGKEESADTPDIFKIPSDWVNTPHLRIRFNRGEGKFYLASFGEKTILNEKEVPRSETAYPNWTELPVNSRLVLNGIVGINIFKA
jgi:hypothetical protein